MYGLDSTESNLVPQQSETLVGSIAVDGEPVFDGVFRLISYALGNVGLSAAEVELTRDEKVYTMEIVTSEAEAERSAINDSAASEQPSRDGDPIIVEAEEISPRYLMVLKATPTELLLPHLVEQQL